MCLKVTVHVYPEFQACYIMLIVKVAVSTVVKGEMTFLFSYLLYLELRQDS